MTEYSDGNKVHFVWPWRKNIVERRRKSQSVQSRDFDFSIIWRTEFSGHRCAQFRDIPECVPLRTFAAAILANSIIRRNSLSGADDGPRTSTSVSLTVSLLALGLLQGERRAGTVPRDSIAARRLGADSYGVRGCVFPEWVVDV